MLVIQTHCVPCSSFGAALPPPEITQNRKENEHFENFVFDVVAAL